MSTAMEECARDSQMDQQMKSLNTAVKTLQKNIEQLAQRLVNVLRSEPNTAVVVDEKATQELVAHANAIRTVADDIARTTSIVADLRDRLEV